MEIFSFINLSFYWNVPFESLTIPWSFFFLISFRKKKRIQHEYWIIYKLLILASVLFLTLAIIVIVNLKQVDDQRCKKHIQLKNHVIVLLLIHQHTHTLALSFIKPKCIIQFLRFTYLFSKITHMLSENLSVKHARSACSRQVKQSFLIQIGKKENNRSVV